MWDLDGRDRNRPLSEMIDMQAYRERRARSERREERERDRREHRNIVFCFAGLIVSSSYMAYVMVPDGFWTSLAAFIDSH